MSKKNRQKDSRERPWKKKESSENEGRIKRLLLENPRRFNVILRETEMSQTTLIKHLKSLIKMGEVERVFDKSEGAVVYQIVPMNKDRVSAHEKRSEAVRHLNGILNPVHSEEGAGNKRVAVFSSVPGNMRREDVKKIVDNIAKQSKRTLWLLRQGAMKNQKIAVVITIDG